MKAFVKSEQQYYYNPWLLAILYGRVFFLDQLLALYRWLRPSHRVETRRILQETRGEQLVQELAQLQQSLQQQLFPFDWGDLNFEYALYRLTTLFRPTDVYFHHHCANIGQLYACECALTIALPNTGESILVFEALIHYIGTHYTGTSTQSGRLLAILLNGKYCMEHNAALQDDSVVCYNRALLLTMMYCVLLDELLNETKRQQTQLLYELSDTREELRRLDTLGRVLQLLHQICQQQYVDEFKGYAVQAEPQAIHQGCASNHDCNRQYALINNPEPTLQQMTGDQDWHFVDCDTGQFHYLQIHKHSQHYVRIARRFIFDCILRRLHCDDDVIVSSLQQRHCQVCRYFQEYPTLELFYNEVELYHCLQLEIGENLVPAEQRMHRVLQPMQIEPLGSIKSLIYKTLYELQQLFLDYEQQQPQQLFQMINLIKLEEQVQVSLNGLKLDCEADCIIRACRTGSGSVATRSQCELALRIVLLERIQRSMDEQRLEIESYERSLCNSALGLYRESSEQTNREIQVHVARIYFTFRQVLTQWLDS